MERNPNSYEELTKRIRDSKMYALIFGGISYANAVCGTTFSTIAGGLGFLIFSRRAILASRNIRYCDEYTNIKESYNNIKGEIIESIEGLKLTDIVDVFAYITYILNNGYLSFDKSTKSSINYGFRHAEELQKEFVLNNHGDELTKSLLLADILNESSIITPATILSGHSVNEADFAININHEDVEEYMKHLIENEGLRDKKDISYTNQELIEYLISSERVPIIENPSRKDVNHAITVATHNMYCYYLDVINGKFLYKLNGFESILVGDNIAFSISEENLKRKNWHYDINPIALEEHRQESPKEVERKYHEAKDKILSNGKEIDKLYENIQPELESAEKNYQRVLKSL